MKKDDVIIMRPIRCDINGQSEENSVKITWGHIETEEQCLLKKYQKMYGKYTFNSIVSERDLFRSSRAIVERD